jgi:large subunit ribosomal protein L4
MKTLVYNQEGKEMGEALLPKEIFDVKLNADLVHQVVVAQAANRRKVIADTKDRSEVSGGGKKPWRQKGTGRARHGSTRSPLWRHGGITFGPTSQVNFKKEIPNAMKRKALFMVLSEKAKNNLVLVLEDLKLETAKTKIMAGILSKLPSKKETALIALPSMDKKIISAARNIPGVATMQVKDLNCFDALSFKYFILSKESIKVIKESFIKSK